LPCHSMDTYLRESLSSTKDSKRPANNRVVKNNNTQQESNKDV